MVGINLVCVGALKENYLKEACGEYIKRLGRFCKFQLLELSDIKPQGSDPAQIKLCVDKESQSILKNLSGFVVLLDLSGQALSSPELAKKMASWQEKNSTLTFVIGGSFGVNDAVKSAANFKWSFSPLTFPHQLMRLMCLEQIYRAFTITQNLPYHK